MQGSRWASNAVTKADVNLNLWVWSITINIRLMIKPYIPSVRLYFMFQPCDLLWFFYPSRTITVAWFFWVNSQLSNPKFILSSKPSLLHSIYKIQIFAQHPHAMGQRWKVSMNQPLFSTQVSNDHTTTLQRRQLHRFTTQLKMPFTTYAPTSLIMHSWF